MPDDIVVNVRRTVIDPVVIKKPYEALSDGEYKNLYPEDWAKGYEAGMAGMMDEKTTFSVWGMWAFALGYMAGAAYAEGFERGQEGKKLITEVNLKENHDQS